MSSLALNTISYDTHNLESQGHEYVDLGSNLRTLLEALDSIMNETVSQALAGDNARDLARQYMQARDALEKYPNKITAVGNSLMAASQAALQADGSLIGDVDITLI